MPHRPHRLLLPLADAVGILVFATVGLLSHERGLSASGYARDALPVLGCWLAAGVALGAYRRPSLRTFLATWLVGAAGGIVVRGLALGREPDADQAAFLGVTLGSTLVFVGAARGALALGRRALRPAAARP